MATVIKVPDSAYSDSEVTLSGKTYIFTFKFNSRNSSWYLDLKDSDGDIILAGIKIMPNQNLTGRYISTTSENFPDGNLWCFRALNDFSPIGRDNFGLGKTYELTFLTHQDEEDFGIGNTIQL